MKITLRVLCLLFCVTPVTASGHDVQPSRDAAIQTFSLYAGKLRGDLFLKNGGVSDQIGLGMSNPDSPVRQDDGTWLIAGCRAKSCMEKAAIIATSGGEALAGGIVYYECSAKAAAKDCFSRPHLAIFQRRSATSPSLARNLADWARRELAAYKDYHPLKIDKTRMLPN